MMLFKTMTLVALAALMPVAALAQSATSPHQHTQTGPATATRPAGQHQVTKDSEGQCDCCAMMKEMVQMMHKMHQPGDEKVGPEHQDHEDKPGD